MQSFSKVFFILLHFVAFSLSAQVQITRDYQLRLEPVWSRVADAMGELGSVESAEFSPNGKYIISATKFDYSLVMWRTSDGAELWRTYHKAEIERAGWSSNNQYVAACSEDFKTIIYEAESGNVVETITHNQGIDGLAWSNKSMLLATGEEYSYDPNGKKQAFLDIFDMVLKKNVAHIDVGNTINELAFTADDAYLVAIGHGGIKVYDTKTWKLERELLMDKEAIFTAGGFSPGGKFIIAAQNKPVLGQVHLIDWREAKVLATFYHTGKKTETIAFHPSGEYIAFAGHTPYIHIYRLQDILSYNSDLLEPASLIWAGDHAEYLDFNTDGGFMVSAHQNGLIKLWAWMGEDPTLNKNRHRKISSEQVSPEGQNK